MARADEVWSDIERAWERVSSASRAMDGPGWAFQLSDIAGGLGGALMDVHVSAPHGNAQYFADLSAEYLDRLRTSPGRPTLPSSPTSTTGAPLPQGPQMTWLARHGSPTSADSLRWPWVVLSRSAASSSTCTAPNQESAEQAVTSNLGGFAASVGTSALVGTAIGGPVGTVVGAGVGVFTSGMIDELWDNGGDVGDAVLAGADAVVDAGEAVADVGGAIVDGIGGLFD